MKSRYTLLEFPVFSGYTVHVEIASDIQKAMKKYPASREITLENSEAVTVHVCDETFTFIFLQPNASVGTIAHEAWHAVRHMMEEMGMELDHECVAYHLGYLVNKIFRFMRRK